MRKIPLLVAFTFLALLGVGTVSASVIGEPCPCTCGGVHEPALCGDPRTLPRGHGTFNAGFCLAGCLRAAGGNRP